MHTRPSVIWKLLQQICFESSLLQQKLRLHYMQAVKKSAPSGTYAKRMTGVYKQSRASQRQVSPVLDILCYCL